MSRQPLGQHFLANPAWQRRILETLPKDPAATWIEIGPGHGEMTRHLAQRGARVVAIETDPRLAARLREIIAAAPSEWPGAEIVEGDILRQDLAALAPGRLRIYGSLPYYITSPILHHLFRFAERIDSIHVVVQFEVAARIVARPGRRDYGYLSVASQFYTNPEIVLRIPPGAFRPPPRVNSALLRMSLPGGRAHLSSPLREEASQNPAREEEFLKFVQLCFAQKRKTLRNNLRAVATDSAIQSALEAAGVPQDARAEQLSIPQFAELFARLG
jgi:16S rRNA (adenine1518-N6/adenine1519-N6)-dimethyltransferase